MKIDLHNILYALLYVTTSLEVVCKNSLFLSYDPLNFCDLDFIRAKLLGMNSNRDIPHVILHNFIVINALAHLVSSSKLNYKSRFFALIEIFQINS